MSFSGTGAFTGAISNAGCVTSERGHDKARVQAQPHQALRKGLKSDRKALQKYEAEPAKKDDRILNFI
jgi:hypothetical protein